MSEIRRKLVIVGDGACGKVSPHLSHSCIPNNYTHASLSPHSQTCLLIVFSKGTFPEVRTMLQTPLAYALLETHVCMKLGV